MSRRQYEWTIMLYLSGDNSLSEDMVRALNDIETQGPPNNVAITIQYDPRAPAVPTLLYALGEGIPARERDSKELEAKFGPLPIPEHIKDVVDNENSADPKLLADFIRWSATNYQSRYRMLILSGHGSGAVGDFLTDANAKSNQPGSLTIPRLKEAFELARQGGGSERRHPEPFSEEELESGGKPGRLLHVLGMDSCLMGMAEVCHEVQDFAGYLVGSEGFVPNAGWPYDHLLERLKGRADGSPENMARWIVQDVVSHYEAYVPAGVSIDMAACDLQQMPKLTIAVASLSDLLREQLGNARVQDLIVAAHWRAQSYKREQHTDLWDFCSELGTSLARSDAAQYGPLITACGNVLAAIEGKDGGVVVEQGFCGVEFQHSHGISVYFPWSASARATLSPYARLRFPGKEASRWSKFLAEYLERTQRPRRGEDQATRAAVPAEAIPTKFGPGLLADGPDHREAERVNREAERVNREAERVNRFIAELYSGFGTTLPWSMKNPPTLPASPPAAEPRVEKPSDRPRSRKGSEARR